MSLLPLHAQLGAGTVGAGGAVRRHARHIQRDREGDAPQCDGRGGGRHGFPVGRRPERRQQELERDLAPTGYGIPIRDRLGHHDLSLGADHAHIGALRQDHVVLQCGRVARAAEHPADLRVAFQPLYGTGRQPVLRTGQAPLPVYAHICPDATADIQPSWGSHAPCRALCADVADADERLGHILPRIRVKGRLHPVLGGQRRAVYLVVIPHVQHEIVHGSRQIHAVAARIARGGCRRRADTQKPPDFRLVVGQGKIASQIRRDDPVAERYLYIAAHRRLRPHCRFRGLLIHAHSIHLLCVWQIFIRTYAHRLKNMSRIRRLIGIV